VDLHISFIRPHDVVSEEAHGKNLSSCMIVGRKCAYSGRGLFGQSLLSLT